MNLNEIALRIKKGEEVTRDEFAYLILNDKEAFLAFCITNNPGSMNNVLRNQLGYTHELNYRPDVKAMGRVCQTILEGQKMEEFKTIIDNFQFNLDNINPKTLAAINSFTKQN